MIRAVFLDIDGTLRSTATGEVPPSARDALAALRRRGVAVAVATGRHPAELEEMGLSLDVDAFIYLNGQLCVTADGTVFHRRTLEGAARDALVALFDAGEVPVALVDDRGLSLNFSDARVEAAQASVASPVPPVRPRGEGPFYMAAVFERADHPDVAALPGVALSSWQADAVDAMAEGPGKLEGVRAYLDLLGADPSEAAAFGDADNDVSMLSSVGWGVAMGGAAPEAAAAARIVTDAVEDDGVLHGLERLGLL